MNRRCKECGQEIPAVNAAEWKAIFQAEKALRLAAEGDLAIAVAQRDEAQRQCREAVKWMHQHDDYAEKQEGRAESFRASLSKSVALLKDCADDLEAYVREHYHAPDVHPARQVKYERDMEPVVKARAFLDAHQAHSE